MKKLSITSCLSFCFAAGALVLGTTGALILHAGSGKNEPDCDHVIVLGYRSENGGPSVTMCERIRRARTYLERHPRTIAILSGGQGEAECMRDALTAAGIEGSRLWLEERSRSTWENMKFSLALIEERTGAPVKQVGIISSEFHIFRAKIYVPGVKATAIPVKTEEFPRWLRNFVREIAGVWHYIILGGTYD